MNLPDEYKLVSLETVDSTNDELRRRFESGKVFNKTVLLSSEQTAGKGRYSREWVSDKGNLFFSVLLSLDCDIDKLSELSFISSIAIRQMLLPVLPDDAVIEYKWPNDVLVNGKKIAGILLETINVDDSDQSHIIIGVGVNVVSCPKEVSYPATNVADENGSKTSLEDLITTFIWHLEDKLITWEDSGFDFTLFAKEWRRNAIAIGDQINVKLMNENITGIFKDISEKGELILSVKGEDINVNAGDIFLINQ